MADKSFQLEIITPNKKLFSGQIASLIAPASDGYLGVLANHAPLITTLSPGKITARDSQGGATVFSSSGSGLLEVNHNQVILLADEIQS